MVKHDGGFVRGSAWIPCVLVSLILLGGCSGERFEFAAFARADRIVVVDPRNEVVREITDHAVIDKVRTFVMEREGGWSIPWYGPPVPRLRIQFYESTSLVEIVGIGHSFLEVQRKGEFYSRPIERAELEELLRLVGIEAADMP